jgi:hypothetical protein
LSRMDAVLRPLTRRVVIIEAPSRGSVTRVARMVDEVSDAGPGGGTS